MENLDLDFILEISLEDSMIGGDEDENDLAALLEECGNMVDRPAVSTPGPEPGPSRQQIPRIEHGSGSSEGTHQGIGVGQGGMTTNMEKLLEQNSQLIQLSAAEKQAGSSGSEGQGKRRRKEDELLLFQDPVLLLDDGYRIEDDAHEVIDFSLRQKLRSLNTDPSTYYKKGNFRQGYFAPSPV